MAAFFLETLRNLARGRPPKACFILRGLGMTVLAGCTPEAEHLFDTCFRVLEIAHGMFLALLESNQSITIAYS